MMIRCRHAITRFALSTVLLLFWSCAARAQLCSGQMCQQAHTPRLDHDVMNGCCKSGDKVGNQPSLNYSDCSGVGVGGYYEYADWDRTLENVTHRADCVNTSGGSACQPCNVAPYQTKVCMQPPETYARRHRHTLHSSSNYLIYDHTWTTDEVVGCHCGFHGCN